MTNLQQKRRTSRENAGNGNEQTICPAVTIHATEVLLVCSPEHDAGKWKCSLCSPQTMVGVSERRSHGEASVTPVRTVLLWGCNERTNMIR